MLQALTDFGADQAKATPIREDLIARAESAEQVASTWCFDCSQNLRSCTCGPRFFDQTSRELMAVSTHSNRVCFACGQVRPLATGHFHGNGRRFHCARNCEG